MIIVDNGSSDGTQDFVTAHFPEVDLLQMSDNMGFGRANNVGIKLVLDQGADYVFLLNQDAYLDKETIERLIICHKSHPQFGLVSPIHFNGDRTALDRNFSIYLGFKDNPQVRANAYKNLEESYEVSFVNAAAWLIPRSTFEIVGGFDPLYFMYGEDDNYCQRLHYHGLKVGVLGNAFIRHDRDQISKPAPVLFSDRYFQVRRKYFLHQLGNINAEDIDDRYFRMSASLRKKIRNAKLKFQFKRVRGFRKEYLMLKKLYPEIIKHRELSARKGPTYL